MRLPGEALIHISWLKFHILRVVIITTRMGDFLRKPIIHVLSPMEGGTISCENVSIYKINNRKTSRGGQLIYTNSIIQRLTGEVDHSFTFPPEEDACGYN